MWKFIYSNGAPADNSTSPAFPAQPEKGNLAELIATIESGANIRLGMARAANIRFSSFATESVRYWKDDSTGAQVAIATLVVYGSNVNYDPTMNTPPWFKGVSLDRYHTPAIVIIDSLGHERFWRPGDSAPFFVTSQPRVVRWFADV